MHLSHQADQLQQRQQHSHSSVRRCVYLALGQATLMTVLTPTLSFLGPLETRPRPSQDTFLPAEQPGLWMLISFSFESRLPQMCLLFFFFFVLLLLPFLSLIKPIFTCLPCFLGQECLSECSWNLHDVVYLCITSLQSSRRYRDRYLAQWRMNIRITPRAKKLARGRVIIKWLLLN